MIVYTINAIAMSLELIGALFLANHYLKVRAYKVPQVLLSALFGGKSSQELASLSMLTTDDPLISLRGLAFLSSGFLLQLLLTGYLMVDKAFFS